MNPRTSAFTLMELLVVITIISLLAAMLLPATGMVRSSAKSMVCMSNMRQIGMAFSNYANDNDGMTPPYLLADSLGNGVNFQASIDAGVPHYFWFGALVGSLEDGPGKASKVYICPDSCFPKPSTKGWGLSYGYNSSTPFINKVKSLTNNCQTGYFASQFTNLSTRILIAERWGADILGVKNEGWNVTPPYPNYSTPMAPPLRPGGKDPALRLSHRGGSNYLLFDGHVEFMTPWKQVNLSMIGGFESSITPNWWVGNP
jgi:prepilin-type N-terminal cleavage/methylation domain-containing protein/prepilin-type processing-associated H-X9-DG protein